MRLDTTGTSILIGKYRDPIDPRRAEAVLKAQGRHPLIARVLAWGGYTAAMQLSKGDAAQAGRDIGLLK